MALRSSRISRSLLAPASLARLGGLALALSASIALVACGGDGNNFGQAGSYTIGGSLSGLANGQQVTLLDNGADALTLTSNNAFTFATPVATNGSYAVKVSVQPTGQKCSVTRGTGSGVIAAVTTVSVTCAPIAKTVLYSFNGTSGTAPKGTLIQAGDGSFYGTTSNGGANGFGTIFKITPAGVESVLYSFAGTPADGEYPTAGLVQGSDGNFYGTTYQGGGNNAGTIFKVTPTGTESVLYSFSGGADGKNPFAALIKASDGNFYGTTVNGGTYSNGTAFMITPAGVETVLHHFGNASDGSNPYSGLIQASDGNFYGTTANGGANTFGTVFKMTPTGAETPLHSFAGTNDGATPLAKLIQASDGNFYGTTQLGGANSNNGTAFMITPAGVETVLHSFGSGSDGAQPYAELIQDTYGDFYGTTYQGGANGAGTIFKVTSAGVETVVYSFTGAGDGSTPQAGLIEGSDGNFYGTTVNGGANSDGTVFTIN